MSAAGSRPVDPSEAERGLASHDPEDLASLVLPAWDAFIELAAGAEMHAASRLPGWAVRDVCVHLGSWPGSRSLERLLVEAREGEATGAFEQDEHNAALLEAHRRATREEVLERLEAARESAAEAFDSAQVAELATRPVRSVLGPLPLLTVVVASCYELAVHALDLQPAGGRPLPEPLAIAGVAALTDVTGALAARCGVSTSAACLTPEGGWAFASEGPAWATVPVVEGPASPRSWPSVEGRPEVLLDASAGRRHVPALLARRELTLHHVGGLLALAPIVESVPGLPGAGPLSAALRHVQGVTSLVRRLPGLRG